MSRAQVATHAEFCRSSPALHALRPLVTINTPVLVFSLVDGRDRCTRLVPARTSSSRRGYTNGYKAPETEQQ